MDGYICYRHDRQDGRQGGGVACYVRQNQPFCLLTPVDTSDVESLWLIYRQPRMTRSMSHIIFAVVYHPPDAVSYVTSNHIVDNVDAIIRQHPYAGSVICGDFNKMSDKSVRDLGLKQIVRSATRNTATLDKIYTNIDQWYQQPSTLPSIGKSDHQAVILLPISGGKPTVGHRVSATVRSNDCNSKCHLARDLYAFDWSALDNMTSTEAMTDHFYNVTTSLLDQHLPLRIAVRYSTDKPWVTDEFRRLVRKRQYAWTNKNTADYKRLRNRVIRLSKELRKRFYVKKIDSLRSCDPSNWWRQTKQLIGQSTKPDLIGLANDLTEGNIHELARRINESLVHVSADLTRLSTDSNYNTDTPSSELDYVIDEFEIFCRLERVNIRKAPGPDNLPNWFLRDFAFALCSPLCHIFNSSIREGVVPTVWKRANVVPIPKTRPPRSVEQDLRPISLTPTISKVFESLVGRWMIEEIGDKFDRKQFGALKGRSTSHALVDITHKWLQALDEHKSVRAVFVDYAKAFDHVDHTLAMDKLAALGVSPILLRWLHSFLLDRQQRVKIGDVLSDWLSPNGSMPQGTYLGCYVFLALINDLQSQMELHKYVDDCTLSEFMSRLNLSNMQREVDDLNKWSMSNLMNINAKKTKEILLGPVRKNPPPILQLNGQPIERVRTFKLLGLHVTDTMKWHEHVSNVCSKAAKRLHFLKMLKHAGMSNDNLLYYYQSVIRPVTEYGCAVWHTSLTKGQSKQLESVQRRAVKIIYGSDSSDDVLHTIPTLSDRRDKLTRQFCAGLQNPSSCLHDLLPAERDSQVTSRVRNPRLYSPLRTRTERFKKSTIVYALHNYQ